MDWWAKGLAPSEALRRWFGHDPAKYPEFLARYRKELQGNPDLEKLKGLSREGRVTLLYAAKERRYNNAWALKEILETR